MQFCKNRIASIKKIRTCHLLNKYDAKPFGKSQTKVNKKSPPPKSPFADFQMTLLSNSVASFLFSKWHAANNFLKFTSTDLSRYLDCKVSKPVQELHQLVIGAMSMTSGQNRRAKTRTDRSR